VRVGRDPGLDGARACARPRIRGNGLAGLGGVSEVKWRNLVTLRACGSG
jgi:hypothetical protein